MNGCYVLLTVGRVKKDFYKIVPDKFNAPHLSHKETTYYKLGTRKDTQK